MALPEHDLSFKAMGCQLRVLVGPAIGDDASSPEQAAELIRETIESFDRKVSRFKADSELTMLNEDPRETVPASALLRSVVSAGIWAAEASNGLLDPTLVPDLERIGYSETMRDLEPVPLGDALNEMPQARPAAPSRTSKWRLVSVDDEAGTITRPPGVRIDSGGVGKGLIADAAASMLSNRERFCVNASGDLRIGGRDAIADPYRVNIEDPFGGDKLATVRVGQGAVATSGIGTRIWKSDGGYSHHLIDPSTGQSAWTGIVQVTAMAPTALEAETRAKQVLLGGRRSTHLLERDGGLVLLDDGTIELVGAVADAVERRHLRIVQGNGAVAA